MANRLNRRLERLETTQRAASQQGEPEVDWLERFAQIRARLEASGEPVVPASDEEWRARVAEFRERDSLNGPF